MNYPVRLEGKVETATILTILLGAINLSVILLFIIRNPARICLEKIQILNQHIVLSESKIEFLALQSSLSAKRIEGLEKVISVLLSSGFAPSGSDGDIVH